MPLVHVTGMKKYYVFDFIEDNFFRVVPGFLSSRGSRGIGLHRPCFFGEMGAVKILHPGLAGVY